MNLKIGLHRIAPNPNQASRDFVEIPSRGIRDSLILKMTATIELSYYPLREDYPDRVILFLEKLKQLPGTEIQTNGMSTILIGEFGPMWKNLGELISGEFSDVASLFVLKVAPGRREYH